MTESNKPRGVLRKSTLSLGDKPRGNRQRGSNPNPPRTRKPEGHDRLLKAAVDDGLLVTVYLSRGNKVRKAILASADKYALVFKTGEEGRSTEIIFKHDISRIVIHADASEEIDGE